MGIVLISLILCVAAFAENSGKTYEYDGKTVFVVGENFDFDKSFILQKDENGRHIRKVRIGKKDVLGFSTETAGSKECVVRVANTEIKVSYTVCSAPQSLVKAEYDEIYDTQRIYRDLVYGTRLDETNPSNNQTFDMYLPKSIGSLDPHTPVILYVHGGAWMSGDKDGDGNALCEALVDEGFVVFSMNYRLATISVGGGTIDEMISDIDAMVAHLKLLLPELGLTTSKIGLGGISAGGHLTSLYAYKKGNSAPLDIAFEIDIVGPNQFGDIGYKKTIEPYLYAVKDGDTVPAFLKTIFQSIAVELIYSLSGFPKGSVPELELIKEGKFTEDMDLVPLWGKVDEFSPVTYINQSSCPTILAYGKLDKEEEKEMILDSIPDELDWAKGMLDGISLFPDDVFTDTMVPTTCYDTMTERLQANGVPHVGKLFEGYSHMDVACEEGYDSLEWIVEQVKDFAKRYIK